MRILQVKISNFRSYADETIINFNDLTAFVGKNDAGKSSILEALDIFFNEGKGSVKIDKDDVNKACIKSGNSDIKISVVFENMPASIDIDAGNPTTLADEYLLNSAGKLEIIKVFPNAGKEKVYIKANHPTNNDCKDLLLKKQDALRKQIDNLGNTTADKNRNASMRREIWAHYSTSLDLQEIEIDISKLDEKNIWEQLKNYMPSYALFQSDRKNEDGDTEIQDPMKIAAQTILKEPAIAKALADVTEQVTIKLKDVAERTCKKLNEMNPEITKTLNPVIPAHDSLKWIDVFKSISICGDNDIPLNKRGSGVKRLVLLNFFRAEAERRKTERNVPDIIYAIEEPETSQHPDHQRKLIDALKELSTVNNTQIILTTHSPALVKMLNFEHLKLVQNKGAAKEITDVERNELPYPSLNEVNFVAFSEANEEYHNELYGFIEHEGWLTDYKSGKKEIEYKKVKGGNLVTEKVIQSIYIRHQIHHPENTNNIRFTNEQLIESVNDMRTFISQKQAAQNQKQAA